MEEKINEAPCDTCLYKKNCVFIARHKVVPKIVGCTRWESDDVEPVRHGYWITKEPLPRTYGRSRAMCCRCGQFALYELINAGSFKEQLTKFCPNCGAKLDLEAQ